MPVAKKRRKSDRIPVHDSALVTGNLLVTDSSSDPYGALSQPQTDCPYGDHRKKKNCANNPWCLLDLIDEKKGIWKPQPTCILKLGHDPAYMRRDLQGKSWKLTPSGIQNLGATCYLNVLIQMLHQNVLVRDAILNMQVNDSLCNDRSIQDLSRSSVENDTKVDEKEVKDAHMNFVVGALQDTFGHLSSCIKGQHDLSLFVDLLELNKTEQQDPQEFSKLFFAKLDDSQLPLRDASLPDIKQLISGKEVYSTTCTICGTVSSQSNEFREIGLNIEDCSSLELAMSRYQAAEMLEGANQFSCSTCDKKTDARRCVEISQTPNLLILKLMRYYYDRKTNNKKKFQTALTFPPQLEVNNEEFELTAVLYHKGNSAHGGHYVAELLEWEENNWWMFDDCSVTPTLNPATSFTSKKRSKVAPLPSNGQGSGHSKSAAASRKAATALDTSINHIDDEMDVVVDFVGGTSNCVRPYDQYRRQTEDDNAMILDDASDTIITKKKVRKTSSQREADDDFILKGEKPFRGRGRLKASGAVVMDLSQEHAPKHDAQSQLQLELQHGDNNPYVTNLTDSPSFGHISLLECTSAEDDALDLIDLEKEKSQLLKRKRGVKSSKKTTNKDIIPESSSGSAEGGEQGEGQGYGEASTPSPSHSPNLDRSKVLSYVHYVDHHRYLLLICYPACS